VPRIPVLAGCLLEVAVMEPAYPVRTASVYTCRQPMTFGLLHAEYNFGAAGLQRPPNRALPGMMACLGTQNERIS
jgi:hypothetical protein